MTNTYRDNYNAYIQSKAWRAKREQYWNSKLPQECYCCGTPRRAGFHLHHRTYKNLGNERLMDLVPVCPECHDFIHYVHKNHNGMKQKGLWAATHRAKKIIQKRAKKYPFL